MSKNFYKNTHYLYNYLYKINGFIPYIFTIFIFFIKNYLYKYRYINNTTLYNTTLYYKKIVLLKSCKNVKMYQM